MPTVIFIMFSHIYIIIYVVYYKPAISRGITVQIIYSEILLVIINIFLLAICFNIDSYGVDEEKSDKVDEYSWAIIVIYMFIFFYHLIYQMINFI